MPSRITFLVVVAAALFPTSSSQQPAGAPAAPQPRGNMSGCMKTTMDRKMISIVVLLVALSSFDETTTI